MKPKIVVVGSSNTDLVVRLPRIPGAGETVIGGTFSIAAGGKGANQAVAAARAGGDVTFIAKLGDDHFGSESLEQFRLDGIATRYVGVKPGESSGVALILVDEHGENCIGVASGANASLSPADIEQAAGVIATADVLLLQLETPMHTVETAVRIASEAGVTVILNPAPAQPLSPSLLRQISIITPNEHEAEFLTGVRVEDEAGARTAARTLHTMGIPSVIITLGARGAFLSSGEFTALIPGIEVKAIDTTAAGDVFNGALAVSLGEGSSLGTAAAFANAAAAYSVSRLGAQPSAPTREMIEGMLGRKR